MKAESRMAANETAGTLNAVNTIVLKGRGAIVRATTCHMVGMFSTASLESAREENHVLKTQLRNQRLRLMALPCEVTRMDSRSPGNA